MSLPERINVIRCITYDVSKVVEDLKEKEVEPIDIDTVINYIHEWVEEDMRAFISRYDLVYQDENGQEL